MRIIRDMETNTKSITETIKAAFAKGEKSVLVGTQYGDVLITKKRTSYKAQLIEKGMNVATTTNDPIVSLYKLGPFIRAAYYRDYSNQYFG
jgi:hypothetical protein